jgi:endonuclease YncB( thermonuclease family)
VKILLLGAVLAALTTPAWSKDCGPLPGAFDGVAFSGDGDNIYGIGFPHSIRLWGINAPEERDGQKAETVPGMRARAALEDLLERSDHKVRCEVLKFDPYCRIVAWCKAGDADLGLEMLKRGMAFGFYLSEPVHGDATLSLAYAAAEAEARHTQKGLWPGWLGIKPAVEQAPPRP